jgi:hypothetical protein
VAYWLLVTALLAAQAAYTLAAGERLLYEEAAEGIRNPYWLEHRLVYDGVSSNVGWYGLLLIAYKTFGFSTAMARYVRLALHVPFLICSASLLERALGPGRAWVALLAIALSPTQLYFNSVGTSYGIDVQLLPVVVFLIVHASNRSGNGRLSMAVRQFAIGCVAMFACLAFPSFLVYLPPLLGVYVWRLHNTFPGARRLYAVGCVAAGFAAPFAAALIYLKNRAAFLSDPAAAGAGVFRGGGSALTLDLRNVQHSIASVAHDLWVSGSTYYFTIPRVEFSGVLGVLATAGIMVGAVVASRTSQRRTLALAGVLCLLSLAAPAFAGGLPGLRRSTGFISGFYVVLICVWGMPAMSAGASRIAVQLGRFACLLLVVHHLAAYEPNRRHLVSVNGMGREEWFNQFGSPDESIKRWALDWALKGRPLDCRGFSTCRYSEVYPAVAGYLEWNGLGKAEVLAVDPGSSHIIRLSPLFWDRHLLDH